MPNAAVCCLRSKRIRNRPASKTSSAGAASRYLSMARLVSGFEDTGFQLNQDLFFSMPRLITGVASGKVTFTPWQTVASRWADIP